MPEDLKEDQADAVIMKIFYVVFKQIKCDLMQQLDAILTSSD